MNRPPASPRARLELECLEQRLLLSADFRAIDGSDNNLANPDWGSAGSQLLRLMSIAYGDDLSTPAGADRPGARAISNAVIAQDGSLPSARLLSGFVFQWGQFIDHDLDLTEGAVPAEPFNISVPSGDPFFDPNGTGTQIIGLNRSLYDTATGIDSPRQQINQITAYIDASNVYGSDQDRADALRTFSGGKLKTSAGNLLPFNLDGLPNGGGPSPSLFIAGDVRSNEQVALTAMHTLFVREHNRLADVIAAENPGLSDEEIYQRARRIVAAEIQVITYKEFLPAVLGPAGRSEYQGYDDSVNAGVSNVFSAAAFRVGHTMLPSELLQVDAAGNVSPLPLRNAFFNPSVITGNGIEPILRGLAAQVQQEIDAAVVDDVRNFLFGPPGSGGFDLASLNIQRGRDHGLPGYNQARIDFGLAPITSFAQITSDAEVRDALRQVYGDVNKIDVWVGGIAEDHLPGSSLGELFTAVWVDQFERARDGDRFWYQREFSGQELIDLENTRLADIIRRNTDINNVQDEVFRNPAVLVFRAAEGQGPADVTLRRGSGRTVQVINNDSGAVLASRALADTEGIVLFGTSQNDRIVIDLSAGRLNVPVEVHGGDGIDTLVLVGRGRSDAIILSDVTARVNGTIIYYGGVENVSAKGGGGSDLLMVAGEVSASVALHGEDGNDIVIGGGGDDLLLGGDGNDILLGLTGNDILIGGAGRDLLDGGAGENVLIGGTTTHDDDDGTLRHMMEVWTGDGSREDRIAALTDAFLNEDSVRDDHALDLLFFDPADDWMVFPFPLDILLPKRR